MERNFDTTCWVFCKTCNDLRCHFVATVNGFTVKICLTCKLPLLMKEAKRATKALAMERAYPSAPQTESMESD